ncbi:MAG: 2-isopropylmalate synthase [Candidatus Omnitrophica bacterium]|nr:2-isopropylmalate synthase [Candidatus Omnitrophota bacterium]
MAKEDRVLIFDTTLRDGEQAPGASMNQREKLEVAFALERLGVDIIEAGFPVISKGDFESVSMVAKKIKNCSVAGLARSVRKDIDAAAEALKPAKRPRIHVFLATSKIHMEHKLRKTPEEIVQIAVDAVKRAREFVDDVEFSPEDASRSEKKFLYRVLEAVIKAGARTVNIPDTVGYAMPEQYGQLIADIRNNVPNINKAVISVHCHDDLGLAVANSLAAVKNGARQVECTVNGIGERAGNCSMEEVVMALRTRQDYFGCSASKIRTPEICRTSRLVSKYTGFVVPPNKAIVGGNAFRHESGIHQDGVLKEPTTYEIMRPEDVGFTGLGLILGKHSGRQGLKARLKQLGIDLNDEQLAKAFDRFKDLSDKKKEVFDEDLIAIVEDESQEVREIWTLDGFVVTSGTGIKPKVEVRLKSTGKVQAKSATGDGPIDACYAAIDEIVGLKGKLLNYGIQSVTQGKDALGEVRVSVNFDGNKTTGIGASTDVIEASVKAYLNALNKACFLVKSKLKVSDVHLGLQP